MSSLTHVYIGTGSALRYRAWLKALRVHQYAKNVLLFVPAFTAHDFNALLASVLAVMAFSLCASSIYLVNDLVDLEADRQHPTKRLRPLASGALTKSEYVVGAAALFVAGMLLGATISAVFLGTLIAYIGVSTLYTLWLKSKLVIDVVVLASLYTMRIVAGGAASNVGVSEWLLIFSIFIFTSLALVKRWVELKTLIAQDLPDPVGRDYKASDLPIIAGLAATSALNSVTIFALYLSSSPMMATYHRPWALWLICPVLLYWLTRVVMLAHRGFINEDPVVFALRDGVSWMALTSMIAIVLFAM